MADLQKELIASLQDKEQEIKSRFKDVADSAGWESHLAESIEFTPSGMKISEAFKAEVEDAEYGDGFGQAPRSAIRKFSTEYTEYVVDALSTAVLETLSTEGSGLFGK